MRCLITLLFGALALSAAPLPWYMQETAMSPDGRLTFLEKPWWPRAKALAEGQSFTLDLNRDGRPDTLVKRQDGNIIEVIDDSGHAAQIENQASAAYVVSLQGTGLVDRMVVFLDNNGDGKADETEFRHYRDGYLRYAWFSEDYDNTGGPVFGLKNWSYGGTDHPANRFRGNMMIYLNKYDPQSREWLPLSECPFSFWDFNHDGHGDVVLRVSAAPLSSNTGKDADYANHYEYMWAPQATPLSQTGNMNVRFSFNVDPDPRTEPLNKPHYNFGFNMVGEQPYQYPDMRYTNPRRRPPQTVVRIPWKDGIAVGMNYPAQTTGFTWNEAHDVWRWEGQFWIFERIFMPNTGGPTMRWNMRREYSPQPASERKLYYSEVDKRYHLFGAREGWLEVGHLVNDTKDLEFRYFDSDGDGYLDTFEVFQGSNPVPVRVTRVSRPAVRPVTLTREALQQDYNLRVLPEAIEQNQVLIAALKKVAPNRDREGADSTLTALAAAYEAEAGKTTYLERRRYCLDVARELYFLKARDLLYTRNASGPYPTLKANPKASQVRERGPINGGYTLGDSLHYWQQARQIEQFVEAYGAGNFLEASRLADQLR